MGFECVSAGDERQCHTTVGVDVEYRLRKHNSHIGVDTHSLTERIKSTQTILIPWAEQLGDKYYKVVNIIRNISYLHLCSTPTDEIRAIGQWYGLAALLTDFVLQKLDNIDTPPSEEMYVQKAVSYINSHLTEKITVGEIAEFLQISDGYLHRVFKSIKGSGIVAYINQQRINAALSLMENRHLSMKKAAYNVGIDDPAYMSRLFRNVTGMSMREYLARQNEKVRNLSL